MEKEQQDDLKDAKKELRSTADARFYHRLHAVMAVKKGYSTREVAALFEVSQRTVQAWVAGYDAKRIDGLKEIPRKGRPSRLSDEQKEILRYEVSEPPKIYGFRGKHWSGRTLSKHILERFGLKLGIRQCERYLADWAHE